MTSAAAALFTAERFSTLTFRMLLLYCFFAPLSIAVSQILIIPSTVYWVSYCFYHGKQRSDIFAVFKEQFDRCRWLAVPMFIWLAISYISGFVGINPPKALADSAKITLYLLLPLTIFLSLTLVSLDNKVLLQRCRLFFLALVFGQFIAALHTFTSVYYGFEISPRAPGPVTESGQLALVIPCAILLLILDQFKGKAVLVLGSLRIPFWVFAASTFAALVLALWPGELLSAAPHLVLALRFGALLLLLAIAVLCCVPMLLSRKKFSLDRHESLSARFRLWILTALLFCALVVNLKRGPWFGVMTELLIIGSIISRRALLGIALVVVLIFTLEPVQERWLNLRDHFEISGGRKNMWNLGVELVQRYPLGVGLKNASVMRSLDPNLPELHRHMHNNLLNVTVETGWMGLFAYLAWMFIAIRMGFLLWLKSRASDDPVVVQLGLFSLFCSIALLGWQVAGSVEYNFGDGEVRLIALFLTGLLLVLKERLDQPPAVICRH